MEYRGSSWPARGRPRPLRSPVPPLRHPRRPDPAGVPAACAPSRFLHTATAAPIPGWPAGASRSEPGSGRSSRRSSTARPPRRSSRIMSPWPRWNSTELSSGHSNRCMPKYGRSSRSVAGRPSSSGMVEHHQHRVDQEDQLPAGAQQAGRFGDPGVRIAPDAGAVLGDRQVEAGVGERRLLGVGLQYREPQPETVLQLTGGPSWADELSRPTGRAPRRASHAET